jgi:hypothetical protein
MSGRAVWLAAGVAVCLALVFGWFLLRSDEPPPPSIPGDFAFDKVKLTSPDLQVALEAVRGTIRGSYTDWSCILICREPEGCHADVRLRVDYRSSGEDQSMTLAGRLDGEPDEAMRIGRVQRPPTPVDSVDRVSIEVVDTYHPGDPTPTPME